MRYKWVNLYPGHFEGKLIYIYIYYIYSKVQIHVKSHFIY